MEERYSVTIKELPSQDRPREKLLRYGAESLSKQELLAILLRTGTKDRSALAVGDALLQEHNQSLRAISRATVKQLSRIKGIGLVKGIQIAAAVELGRRLEMEPNEDRDLIRSPEDAKRLFLPHLRDAPTERFKVMLLNTRNHVLRIATVSVGSLDSSIVHPRDVFREAIDGSAAAIIVAHNHPSGDPSPSPEDRQVTARLVEAGKILGIDVLDHLILGGNRWVSLKERGLM